MQLPEEFIDEMTTLLGQEGVSAYLASLENPVHHGLRVNNLKLSTERFAEIAAEQTDFALRPVPWIKNGFFVEGGTPSKHPWYTAGLYYLQEPSAMTPASLLPISQGDVVLDLCAAPGGKATELAAKLNGSGFLLANDISNSRAQALLRNLERFGVTNMAVCSEESGKLAQLLPEYFDKILVDAPCSGEGMFHKEPGMLADWEARGPEYYSKLQRQIILDAATMLRPGGMMLFSTCTFSRMENEETITWLLGQCPEMRIVPVERYEGFAPGCSPCEDAVRIFPHLMEGEGHFVCLLQRAGEAPRRHEDAQGLNFEDLPESVRKFFNPYLWEPLAKNAVWSIKKDKVYLLPKYRVLDERIRFLRTGLLMGTLKKDRFEPSQALAMASKPDMAPLALYLPLGDERIARYLRGETISYGEFELRGMLEHDTPHNGHWVLVCVGGFPLGFAKAADGQLKNKLDAGWRVG